MSKKESSPAPVKAKAEAPVPQKMVAKPSAPRLTVAAPVGPVVRLDAFLAAHFKRDQAAGFERWAKNQKMGPRPIVEWRKAVAVFSKRPV